MLKEYRKTSTIKAEQFDGSDEMIKKYGIIKETFVIDGWGTTDDYRYCIKTREGKLIVNIGDWIATGVESEHWTIADDVFKKTYAELPVIPKVYGDTIEEFKANRYRLSEMFDEWDWNYDEQDLIARAWLDGYQVE